MTWANWLALGAGALAVVLALFVASSLMYAAFKTVTVKRIRAIAAPFDVADLYLVLVIALLYAGLAPIFLSAAHLATAAVLLTLILLHKLGPRAAGRTDDGSADA